jgi:nucleoside-diphosphate-sugar epimerase
MAEKKLFIFGLGFAAQAVAQAAIKAGFSVAGTCRAQEKCNRLKKLGIDAMLFENVTPEIIAGYNYILSSIPPQGGNDVVIAFLHRQATWMGYFSTTGVYGDHKCEWVNEGSFLYPNNKRLLNRIVAEARWIVRGGEVFRLAGIYGKGRSAIDDVMDGSARRIYKEGQVFSRIHVEDIAQVILAVPTANHHA